MYAVQGWLGDRLFQFIFWLAGLRPQKAHPIGWGADCDRQRDEATIRHARRRQLSAGVIPEKEI